MKVGVIGAGMWGKNHVKTLHEMGCLGVVVEMNDTLRNQTQSLYPDTPCVSSLDQVFGDSRLDSEIGHFVIATPAHTHTPVGVQCLEAGKDILVEKPMTLSVADAQILIDKARAVSKQLMVGHLLLFQPAIAFIREYLESGKLGEIYTLHQVRSKLGRARANEDVLWSFGVHDVAVLLHLIGEAPEKVNALGHKGLQPEIADDVYVQMEFDSGVIAHLHNSWLWPEVERKLTIVGSKGMLVYDELAQNVALHRKTIDSDLNNQDEGSEIVFEGAAQPLQLELEHFIHCCETGETPIADGQNGIDVIRVLEAAS